MVTDRKTGIWGEKFLSLPVFPRRFQTKCPNSEPGPLSEEKATNCMSYGAGVNTKFQ
jgi:hypothetical protein